MGVLRTFIAFSIPLCVQNEILKIQTKLRGLELNASWVRAENFHLTLKFLGNIEPHLVPRIVEKMKAVFNPVPQFSLSLGGLGFFPDHNDPRVIWVDVNDPDYNLDKLWNISEDAMADLNFTKESRGYTPHITLGYIKSQNRIEKLKEFMQTDFLMESKHFDISSVSLYQSQPSSEGSKYSVLADVALNGK